MFRSVFLFIATILTYCQSQNYSYQSIPFEENFEQEMSKNPAIYQVDAVVDGDTFWVLDKDSRRIKIRLIGIDAPETKNIFNKKKHPFGAHSKVHLDSMLTVNPYLKLTFDVDSLDQYGRTLAYAYLNNGTFLNEYLVRNGYARLMTISPNVKFEQLFYEAQIDARDREIGVWKE